MVSKVSRSKVREEKHRRMRRHIIGTPERPRMAVFRSNNHMYVQIIDDVAKTTLVSASTLQKDVKEKLEKTNDVAAAAYLGTVIAKKAQEAAEGSLEAMEAACGGVISQYQNMEAFGGLSGRGCKNRSCALYQYGYECSDRWGFEPDRGLDSAGYE